MIALASKIRNEKCGKPSLYIRFMFRMMALSRKKVRIVHRLRQTNGRKMVGWIKGNHGKSRILHMKNTYPEEEIK